MAHNFYQRPGGEDNVFSSDADVLEAHGHTVYRYTQHNDDIDSMRKVAVARLTLWNDTVYKELDELFKREQFDIAHFHNTFPLISPAAYYAAYRNHVPVVQTLQNYRLICPAATFFRDNRVCEDCLGKTLPYPAVVHACYHESRIQSGVIAAMLTLHRLRNTWWDKVDIYVPPTDFVRRKYIEAGFPAEKIITKSNFLQNDPGMGEAHGNYISYAGRLSSEKGILTVLKAWRGLSDIPLKIIGDGPLMPKLRDFVQSNALNNVELLGHISREEALQIMRHARATIMASEWYEPFGLVVIEAFAVGTPVITSAIGGPMEMVAHGVTGLHYQPGDVADLTEKVRQLWEDPDKAYAMGLQARKTFEEQYTAERNYDKLMEIYQRAGVEVNN